MRTRLVLILLLVAAPVLAQDKAKDTRTITISLTVPSSAEKIRIQEVYQTPKEIWVLSQVKGGGIGLAVISVTKDSVKVSASKELPVRHFVLGKRWNWKKENYNYLKNRATFMKKVKEAKAKKIYGAAPKPVRYIVSLKKDFFTNGKTKDGLTLKQVAEKQTKLVDGKFVRLLKIINGYVLTLPAKNVAKLKKMPGVKFVEEDRKVGIPQPGIRPPIRR